MDYILGTEAGGRAFALFVDETGVFLKPPRVLILRKSERLADGLAPPLFFSV